MDGGGCHNDGGEKDVEYDLRRRPVCVLPVMDVVLEYKTMEKSYNHWWMKFKVQKFKKWKMR